MWLRLIMVQRESLCQTRLRDAYRKQLPMSIGAAWASNKWFAAYPRHGRYLHRPTILSRFALRGLHLQAVIEREDRCSARRVMWMLCGGNTRKCSDGDPVASGPMPCAIRTPGGRRGKSYLKIAFPALASMANIARHHGDHTLKAQLRAFDAIARSHNHSMT